MKHFSIFTLILGITLISSACGAKATTTPAVSAVDMQNTAAAVALTMVLQTQAAIPTATPQPTETITNTPAPTNTFLPLPTSETPVALTTVPNNNSGSSGGGDACINNALPTNLQGKNVKIRVNNSTKVAVRLTVYLNQTIPEKVCGYRAYSLEARQSITITDLVEGCFTLWAWNPDQKDYFMVTNGASSCIFESDTPVFEITTSTIKQK